MDSVDQFMIKIGRLQTTSMTNQYYEERDDANNENLMKTAISPTREKQLIVQSTSETNESEEDEQHADTIASHPLFAEIGNLIQSYYHPLPTLHMDTSTHSKVPAANNEQPQQEDAFCEEAANTRSFYNYSTLNENVVVSPGGVSLPSTTASAAAESLVAHSTEGNILGLDYVSSASSEEAIFTSTSYTTQGSEIMSPSQSSSLSVSPKDLSQGVPQSYKYGQDYELFHITTTNNNSTTHEGNIKSLTHVLPAKYDKLVLHVSSRDHEVIRATTALYMSPRDTKSPAAIFLSPRNHLSSHDLEESHNMEPTTTAPATNKATIFTFNDDNEDEDDIKTRNVLAVVEEEEDNNNNTQVETDDSSTATTKKFDSLKMLLSRVIKEDHLRCAANLQIMQTVDSKDSETSMDFRETPSFESGNRTKSDVYKSPTTIKQVNEFQKDVNDFTRRLREIKENVRCDVYLIEEGNNTKTSSSNKIKSVMTTDSRSTDERLDSSSPDDEDKKILRTTLQHQASPPHGIKPSKAEEFVYVFSMDEQKPKETKESLVNQHNVSNSRHPSSTTSNESSNNLSTECGEDGVTLLSRCEKHVNPGLLDHIKKYGNFELYKILPPPPPPPCPPPAMKQDKRITATSNRDDQNSNHISEGEADENTMPCSASCSDDEDEEDGYLAMDFLKTDYSMCDMLRYKLEQLTASEVTDTCGSTIEVCNDDNDYDHSPAAAQQQDKIVAEGKRKNANKCLNEEKEEPQQQTLETSSILKFASRRDVRISALKKKSAIVRKEVEKSQMYGGGENGNKTDVIVQCSAVVAKEETVDRERSPQSKSSIPSNTFRRVLRGKVSTLRLQSGGDENSLKTDVILQCSEAVAKEETADREPSLPSKLSIQSSTCRRVNRISALKKKMVTRRGGEPVLSNVDETLVANEEKIDVPHQEETMSALPKSKNIQSTHRRVDRISALKKKKTIATKPVEPLNADDGIGRSVNEETVGAVVQRPETKETRQTLLESLPSSNTYFNRRRAASTALKRRAVNAAVRTASGLQSPSESSRIKNDALL